jgi:predicted phage terminase large subunit-like protein
VFEKKLYYLDMFRGKPRSREREITAKAFYEDNDSYPFSGMYIEQKASGIDLFQRMKDDGFMVYEVERNIDKVFRAENISPYLETFGLIVADDLPNLNDFIGEYQAFPNGKNDDIVDTLIDGAELAFMNTPFNYESML